MSLSRIFIDSDLEVNESIQLPVSAAHYVKNVLRLKNNQQIILFNNNHSAEYHANIEIQGKHIFARLISKTISRLDSPLKTTLLQALGKPDHIDFIIQKATELGISQIYLFNSQRTQTHLKSTRLEKKLEHWKGIMISACEQCGRNTIPTLSFKSSFQTCLEACENSNKILLDFDGKPISKLSEEFVPDLSFSMLTGPEGGLTTDEIQQAKNANFKSCTLGPRILRMETAAISILNIVQHYYGDMR